MAQNKKFSAETFLSCPTVGSTMKAMNVSSPVNQDEQLMACTSVGSTSLRFHRLCVITATDSGTYRSMLINEAENMRTAALAMVYNVGKIFVCCLSDALCAFIIWNQVIQAWAVG